MWDSKKGISPLVAAVILIAITLTIGILASDFFSSTILSITGDTSNRTQKVADITDYGLEVIDVSHNTLKDNVTATIRNSGASIDGNIVITTFCSDTEPQQGTRNGLNKGEVKKYEVSVPNCGTVEEVTAELEDYPIKREIKKASINIVDFLRWKQSLKTEFDDVNQSSANITFLSSSIELAQANSSKEETSSFSGSKTNVTESGGKLKLETS